MKYRFALALALGALTVWLAPQIKQTNTQVREQKQVPIETRRNGPPAEAMLGEVMRWDVDGERREATVFAPKSDGAAKHPLVFAFHGHGGNMNGASRQMHIQTLWPEAIVVYPHGLQAYAFDFMRDTNHDGQGESGRHILAARPGTVYDLEESQTGNTDQVSKIFFFKGGQYLSVDFVNNRVDPGFPKPVAGNRHGLPQSWNSGIDEVIN